MHTKALNGLNQWAQAMACGREFLDDVAADGFVYLLSRKAGFHTFAVTIREKHVAAFGAHPSVKLPWLSSELKVLKVLLRY